MTGHTFAEMAIGQFNFDYGVEYQPITNWRHTYDTLLRDADAPLPT